MISPTFRHTVLGMLAAPLALGLAACGNSEEGDGSLSGEPIEAIAPPEGENWADMVIQTDEGGYRMGNPEAPIKLIEYGSLTCPHCADFTELASEELRDTFVASGRVSFEFRNFVMNPLDLTMAMLVRCGSAESFFALTEQTFANQAVIADNWTNAGEAALAQADNLPPEQRYQAFAQAAGLDEFYAARGIAADQAEACLADGAAAEALVRATTQQSEEHDITGTPAFLINGQTQDINTWPEVKARLETLGAR